MVAGDRAGSLFIGGGPAGLAPLVWAARQGRLGTIARRGLVLVEANDSLGAGSLGDYAIASDTVAATFLECLDDAADPRLLSLRDDPAAEALRRFGNGAAPLPVVAAFLARLGAAMRASIEACGGTVLTAHRASSIRRTAEGDWAASLQRGNGEPRILTAGRVVLATGAAQRREELTRMIVAGAPLLPEFERKLLLSSEVLGRGGVAAVRRRLRGVASPRIVIVGGSHSAAASAIRLLAKETGLDLAEGAVTILHRRPLRVFYPTVEAAAADGYADFGSQDICPVSGRVYRLAGFRLAARELVMRALGVGGRAPEPRLVLHRLEAPGGEMNGRQLLHSADLVVAATGYRPNALRVQHANGAEWPLLAGQSSASPLVNGNCEVLDTDRKPLPGLYGIGLAAGFLPSGAAGGEPSFTGQTNGLWLWQNCVGGIIAEALLRDETSRAAA